MISINENKLKQIIKEAINKQIGNIRKGNEIASMDELFDLDSIPMAVLDNGWQRYHPYLFTIDHRNPLANRVIEESTDYEKQIQLVRKAIN